MSIKMKLHTMLQECADGKEEVEVEGITVGECINDLIRQYPATKNELFDRRGRLLGFFDIYVNAVSSYPEELKKAVNDGDEITITVFLAGG